VALKGANRNSATAKANRQWTVNLAPAFMGDS
jgi:hypothetical protein